MEAASPSFARNALALLSLLGSTVAALSLVPLSALPRLQEPSVRAAGPMLVVLVSILVLRRAGAVGARRERLLLCVFLAGMPLVYLESGLRHSAGSWLLVEAAGFALFASWAWLAYARDPVWLSLGIAAHGLAWDAWHGESLYIPAWYAHACLVVDLGMALYVLLQRDRLRPAARAVGAQLAAATSAPASAVDARAGGLRSEMQRELSTTLRTLERTYEGVRAEASREGLRSADYATHLQDVRTVLIRLGLLLPSLVAGRAVMPDMAAQQQQTQDAREQCQRACVELGIARAVGQHREVFQQALEALLATSARTLTADAMAPLTRQALEVLSEQLAHVQRASLILQLTLEAEAAAEAGP
ncbi:MAG: hypothetical protein JWN48_5423 [Myxococcaceae bacterium]|nr:hypothetical protein [Myxococcaceae bacterium]